MAALLCMCRFFTPLLGPLKTCDMYFSERSPLETSGLRMRTWPEPKWSLALGFPMTSREDCLLLLCRRWSGFITSWFIKGFNDFEILVCSSYTITSRRHLGHLLPSLLTRGCVLRKGTLSEGLLGWVGRWRRTRLCALQISCACVKTAHTHGVPTPHHRIHLCPISVLGFSKTNNIHRRKEYSLRD